MRHSGLTHLEKDDRLRPLIQEIGDLPPVEARPELLYENLLVSILSQQLSSRAAATIHHRFLELFSDRFPDPKVLRHKTDEELRTAGVSRQKAGYLRNIAARFYADDLVHADWASWSNESVVEHLTEIKGVGTWTAHMILMFTLARPDIFPTGDQGIQSAMENYYGLPAKGKERIAAMVKIAEHWRPYRSEACRYLWRALDAGI